MPSTTASARQRNRLTLLALAVGIATIAAVILLKPQPKPQPPREPAAPQVSVVTAAPGEVALTIAAQGNVEAKVTVDVVSRVAGQVTAVAPQFTAGGVFASGERLVQIERADYQFAALRAAAQLAKADEALALERGRARQAKREWRDLGDAVANALFLREPQLAAAVATQAAAEADLDKANLDLERTAIRLPFDGRIAAINVNLGQFVSAGSRIASVLGSEVALLRLPLTLRQAELIELPTGAGDELLPEVLITLTGGFDERQWRGQLMRTEAVLDQRSRMLVAVVEVPTGDGPALPVGAFVEAAIAGRTVSDAMLLPQAAIYQGDQVLIVDEQNRIHYRTVTVLQNRTETAVVRGLEPGWQVVSSRLSLAIEGQRVTVVETAQ